MSLLRPRFDECQSVAGIGTTPNEGPLPSVRACKEARVRRLEASSVLSEIYRERWPPESHIDHRRAREVRGAREQPADASLVELYPVAAPAASRGLALRQLHTHIALSKQSTAIRAPRSAIKTAAATGRASKPADQTKSSQLQIK